MDEAPHEARFLQVVNDTGDGDVDAVTAVARMKEGDGPRRLRRLSRRKLVLPSPESA